MPFKLKTAAETLKQGKMINSQLAPSVTTVLICVVKAIFKRSHSFFAQGAATDLSQSCILERKTEKVAAGNKEVTTLL